MKGSARLSSRKELHASCIHSCEGDPNSVKMLCPGDAQHGCGGYIWKGECYKYKHRCGQGSCICHCTPCIVKREELIKIPKGRSNSLEINKQENNLKKTKKITVEVEEDEDIDQTDEVSQSRQQLHRFPILCCHNCETYQLLSLVKVEEINLIQCSGNSNHLCSSFLFPQCHDSGHRCGEDSCQCECDECKNNYSLQKRQEEEDDLHASDAQHDSYNENDDQSSLIKEIEKKKNDFLKDDGSLLPLTSTIETIERPIEIEKVANFIDSNDLDNLEKHNEDLQSSSSIVQETSVETIEEYRNRLVRLKNNFLSTCEYSNDICGCTLSGSDCAYPSYRASLMNCEVVNNALFIDCKNPKCSIKLSNFCYKKLDSNNLCHRCSLEESGCSDNIDDMSVISKSAEVNTDLYQDITALKESYRDHVPMVHDYNDSFCGCFKSPTVCKFSKYWASGGSSLRRSRYRCSTSGCYLALYKECVEQFYTGTKNPICHWCITDAKVQIPAYKLFRDQFLLEKPVNIEDIETLCGCPQRYEDCHSSKFIKVGGKVLDQSHHFKCATDECPILLNKYCVRDLNPYFKAILCRYCSHFEEISSHDSVLPSLFGISNDINDDNNNVVLKTINRSSGIGSDPQSPDLRAIVGSEEINNYKWYESINGFLPPVRDTIGLDNNESVDNSDNNIDEAVVYKHNANNNCLIFWSNGDDSKFFVEEMSSELVRSNLEKRLFWAAGTDRFISGVRNNDHIKMNENATLGNIGIRSSSQNNNNDNNYCIFNDDQEILPPSIIPDETEDITCAVKTCNNIGVFNCTEQMKSDLLNLFTSCQRWCMNRLFCTVHGPEHLKHLQFQNIGLKAATTSSVINNSKEKDDDSISSSLSNDGNITISDAKNLKMENDKLQADLMVELGLKKIDNNDEESILCTANYPNDSHEIDIMNELDRLDKDSSIDMVSVTVGGIKSDIINFSYDHENDIRPANQKRKCYYKFQWIDCNNIFNRVYYRYDVIYCVTVPMPTLMPDGSKKKIVKRLYISMCQLEARFIVDENGNPVTEEITPTSSNKQVVSRKKAVSDKEKYRFVLVEILQTLCETCRLDWMVLDTKHGLNRISIWQGWSIMRNFSCKTDYKFNIGAVEGLRELYLNKHSLLYNILRYVKRDIRDPQNRNDGTRDSSNILALGQEDASLVKWTKHFKKSIAIKAKIDNNSDFTLNYTSNLVTIDNNASKRLTRRKTMNDISAGKQKEAEDRTKASEELIRKQSLQKTISKAAKDAEKEEIVVDSPTISIKKKPIKSRLKQIVAPVEETNDGANTNKKANGRDSSGVGLSSNNRGRGRGRGRGNGRSRNNIEDEQTKDEIYYDGDNDYNDNNNYMPEDDQANNLINSSTLVSNSSHEHFNRRAENPITGKPPLAPRTGTSSISTNNVISTKSIEESGYGYEFEKRHTDNINSNTSKNKSDSSRTKLNTSGSSVASNSNNSNTDDNQLSKYITLEELARLLKEQENRQMNELLKITKTITNTMAENSRDRESSRDQDSQRARKEQNSRLQNREKTL